MKETILVTGGCGYIGHHTVKKLLELNYTVIVIDKNLQNMYPQATYYIFNLLDIQELSKVFQKHKIDRVLHLAAYRSAFSAETNSIDYYHNNINILNNLLTVMNKYWIKFLVFGSSCTSWQPEGVYGNTKYLADYILRDISAHTDINIISLKYYNVYGGYLWETPSVVNMSLRSDIKIYSGYDTPDKTTVRSYVHINDVVNANIIALQNNIHYLTYDIATDINISTLEVVKMCNSKYQLIDTKPGDMDIAPYPENKDNGLFNWIPTISLEDSINYYYSEGYKYGIF